MVIFSRNSTSRLQYFLKRGFQTSIINKRSEIAFVFDIDGVLVRGSNAIPSAKPALDLLNKHKVPFILLTNGGGIMERQRVEFLKSKLKVPLSPLQLVQSHTPMKVYAKRNKFNRVLVVGGPGDKARYCALDYGFKDVIMPVDIVRNFPAASPHHRFTEEELKTQGLTLDRLNIDKPIDCILVFNDPRDMGTDIQIILDILNSQGGLIGTKRKLSEITDRETPAVPIIFSNNDFLWANDYNLSRFGQGAVRLMIESLYKEVNQLASNQTLKSTILGKPFKVQYDFAHSVLIDWRQKLIDNKTDELNQIIPEVDLAPATSPFDKIYMVGDNPASDIKGANDHGWESLLLRTGVYQDEDWDNIIAKPTAGVYDNVYESVKSTLERHSIL